MYSKMETFLEKTWWSLASAHLSATFKNNMVSWMPCQYSILNNLASGKIKHDYMNTRKNNPFWGWCYQRYWCGGCGQCLQHWLKALLGLHLSFYQERYSCCHIPFTVHKRRDIAYLKRIFMPVTSSSRYH